MNQRPAFSPVPAEGQSVSGLDYVVLLAYLAGVFAVGLAAAKKVRNSADLFTAGRQAPWWVSGLSSYMTMFSAATFVVWGGVAYRYGVVAIVINLMYGVAAILVGFFVAARWQRLGLTTAAEFIELRFGKAALAGYTLLNFAAKMMTVGVGLYALAVMICALVPLADGNVLQDPHTGRLSVAWTIVLLGVMISLFTVAGGLWAVLITDFVQFVIIMIAVCFVAPLIVARAGGFGAFIAAAPPEFFSPSRGEWTWWILAGWCTIHFMMIGAEWAFVQRYLCVSSERAARKVAWLFGALYLVSPVLWMLPPMVYRTINPNADPEQAYILACQAVLPAGTIGLVLAAMAAATISGIDTQLNVFAAVLTNDFYKAYLNPLASEARLLRVGRLLTIALGGILIGVALVAPRGGGAEAMIVKVGSLCVGPLLLPTIWGLFSRKLGSSAMWVTVALSIAAGLTVFGLQTWNIDTAGSGMLIRLARWLREYPRHADMLVGLVVPLVTLAVLEFRATATSPGWGRIAERRTTTVDSTPNGAAALVLQAGGWTLIGSGFVIGSLTWFNGEQVVVMLIFAAVLLTLGAAMLWLARKVSQLPPPTLPTSAVVSDDPSLAASGSWTSNCHVPAGAGD